MSVPWRAVPGGVALTLRLTPKGGRDAIDGMATLADGETVLLARVRAAPEDGKANAALAALVAEAAGVAKSAVRLVGGGKSRVKRFTIDGDAGAIIAALARIAGP